MVGSSVPEAVVQPTCAHALSSTLYISQQFASSRQGEVMLCQVQASGANVKAKREYHFNSVGGGILLLQVRHAGVHGTGHFD